MKNKGLIIGILIGVGIAIFMFMGLMALIAVPNLAGVRQRSGVSADIRTAEQIGKAVRIWQTDSDTEKVRVIPGENSTNPILYYAYCSGSEGFNEFAGIDYYVGSDYNASSMSKEATYFISSIGEGVKQKIIVGIDELSEDGKTPKNLSLFNEEGEKLTYEDIKNKKYDGTKAAWAYVEQ